MSPAERPLDETEYERLATWFAAVSPFDLEGVLGLLHAVAVAPSLIQPSSWLAVVLPDGLTRLDPGDVEEFLALLFRLHGEVLGAVAELQAIIPEAADALECESFAAGYAAGAVLDPEWSGDAARWSFAAPFAYLGGRLDLVPAQTVEDIERNLEPDPKLILRRDLGALIRATEESFKKLRRPVEQTQSALSPDIGRRVGRNELCPCGSGKKYKRCCINPETSTAPKSAGPSN